MCKWTCERPSQRGLIAVVLQHAFESGGTQDGPSVALSVGYFYPHSSPCLQWAARQCRPPRPPLFTLLLRQENSRPRGSASLQILVRLGRFGQRIPLPHARLDLACTQYIEQFASHLLKITAFGDIAEQRGPREIQRTTSGELGRIDGWQWPRCIAETHKQAQRCEAVERRRIRFRTDGIGHHRDARAVRDLAYPLREV